MAMNYAKMNNFITRVNTLAFDIKNVNEGESILIERTMKNETFSFDVKIKDFYLRQLACYSFGKSLKLTKTKKMTLLIYLCLYQTGIMEDKR